MSSFQLAHWSNESYSDEFLKLLWIGQYQSLADKMSLPGDTTWRMLYIARLWTDNRDLPKRKELLVKVPVLRNIHNRSSR